MLESLDNGKPLAMSKAGDVPLVCLQGSYMSFPRKLPAKVFYMHELHFREVVSSPPCDWSCMSVGKGRLPLFHVSRLSLSQD